MAALKALGSYNELQNSAIEWLGDIPSHWQLKRLKYVVEILKRIAGKEGFDVLSITQKGIKVKDIESGEGQLAMDYSKYQLLYKGEFAMNHMDLLTGYVDISKYDGVVSPDYRAFRNRSSEVLDTYLLLIFQMGYTQRIFYKYGQGVSFLGRWRFPADNFNNFFIPIPSVDEQNKIVEFISRKTAQIDEAIAIKEKQIALLKERKQIIIQKAVTQGLNSDVRMKDSGVDWIGKIPDHWELVPLKRLAKLSPSINVKNKRSSDLACFLAMGKISAEGEVDSNILLPIKEISQGFTSFNKGDVIVAKITPCFENGKSAYLKDLPTAFGYGSTEFHVLRNFDRLNGDFLYLIVRSNLFLKAGEAMMTGSAGQKRVPSSFVANFPTALPPIQEQKEIEAFVQKHLLEIENASYLQKQQIGKLKEYKATLINNAVTGKIKVA